MDDAVVGGLAVSIAAVQLGVLVPLFWSLKREGLIKSRNPWFSVTHQVAQGLTAILVAVLRLAEARLPCYYMGPIIAEFTVVSSIAFSLYVWLAYVRNQIVKDSELFSFKDFALLAKIVNFRTTLAIRIASFLYILQAVIAVIVFVPLFMVVDEAKDSKLFFDFDESANRTCPKLLMSVNLISYVLCLVVLFFASREMTLKTYTTRKSSSLASALPLHKVDTLTKARMQEYFLFELILILGVIGSIVGIAVKQAEQVVLAIQFYLITVALAGIGGLLPVIKILRDPQYLASRKLRPPKPKDLKVIEDEFEQILANPELLNDFRAFILKEFSVENLFFWESVKAFEHQYGDRPDKLQNPKVVNQMLFAAVNLYRSFIDQSGVMPVNISYKARADLDIIFSKVKPKNGEKADTSISDGGRNSSAPERSKTGNKAYTQEEIEALKGVHPMLFNIAKQEIFKLMVTDSYSRFRASHLEQINRLLHPEVIASGAALLP